MLETRITKSLRFILLSLGCLCLTLGAQTARKPVVYTTNYPLEYFASRIAGDLARVMFPAPAGVDPASWVPDEATLLDFQQADLIMINGAGYERWTTTISLPVTRVVDTTQTVADQYVYTGDVVTHTHGPTGEHAHENLAFTTWLDLQMAAEQARAVSHSLIGLFPEHRDVLTQNLHALIEDLDTLDAELLSISERFGKAPLLASHPVYQYFSRRYRFDVQSLHWEPEQNPTAQMWQRLELLLEKHPAKWMIWEAPPLPETTDRLSRLGVTCLVVYPLANRPIQGDFISVMLQNTETLKRIADNTSR